LYCLTESNVNIDSLWLYYKVNNDEQYSRVPVYIVCPQYTGIIEGLLPSDTVHYYLEAESANGTVTYPGSAPAGNFTFWFDAVGTAEKAQEEKTFKIMPQPSSGQFSIFGVNKTEVVRLVIRSISGSVVLEDYNPELPTVNYPLNPGVYIIEIQLEDNKIAQKLIITP